MANPTEIASLNTVAQAVEKQWQKAGDVLTMGGEPTFVPPAPVHPEWHNEAMGPEKLRYALRMAKVLLQREYAGGLAMRVFGKQYPGEPLPRWVVLNLVRIDGVPLWQKPERFALWQQNGEDLPPEAVREIARTIAAHFGFEEHLRAAVNPSAGDEICGWVLPLDYDDGKWISDVWFEPQASLQLLPGDSPVGLRLPLADLPEKTLRRALTVEVEEGALNIFLPPLSQQAFVSLLTCIEDLAGKGNWQRLSFSGYPPPEEGTPFFRRCGLAADPGVLEVNIPPSASWEEYRDCLRSVYSAAAESGLVAWKAALNGRMNGTGGGAHLIFGGPSADKNAFFRHPLLLSSVVRYWQAHPALSYFFTGQYVGPGCQAPRVDETDVQRLYEVELACTGAEQIRGGFQQVFFDRLWRNLLTDAAGNSHRAEICVDKFWNLGSPTGCLGLVEFRALETHPDADVLAVAGLFFRAVITRLLLDPYHQPLRRWGGELHDRFFLPAGLWEDIGQIVDDLHAHGFLFPLEALRAQLEFRFAVLGEMPLPGGGKLVVRQAHEPWPLMAEETRGAATVRLVDNSTDRLEISLAGTPDEDGARLLVNGFPLEFSAVGGQRVAGLRYKCASGWPALHPHLAVQSPLVLDWVSRQDGQVLASAAYHYWNPSGPVYETGVEDGPAALKRQQERWKILPVESRPKILQAADYARPPESRLTLDLRWAVTHKESS